MAFDASARPLLRCLNCVRHERISRPHRAFTTTITTQQELVSDSTPPSSSTTPTQTYRPPLDPNLVHTRGAERKLWEVKKLEPVGSRRRRAALFYSTDIPFQELPYQCFQEARKFLLQDRAEKLEEIKAQRAKIQKLALSNVAPESEARREHQLKSMRHRLEQLKIHSDINDPIVKKKFEDGLGDMNKPIYRYLADLKWRSYKRKVLMQRIQQMNVVPDVLPTIDPTVDVSLSFGRRKVPHGEIVDSHLSENAPDLTIQPFEKGEHLYTIAVVTPDVPNVAKDGFDYRCHFLASNVLVSPTDTRVQLGKLDPETQVVLPWLPAYSQKGAPYQRMSVFILRQPASEAGQKSPSRQLDVPAIVQAGRYTQRHNFILRSFVTKHFLEPVGVDLFRTQWDEGTTGVMERAGIVGADVEFRRKKVEPLPYKRLKGERFR